MKNTLPVLNQLLYVNLNPDLKQSNYKQLYIQCKKNVKQFISIVENQIQKIFESHQKQKEALINQIQTLKKNNILKENKSDSSRIFSQLNSNLQSNQLRKKKNPRSTNNLNQISKNDINNTTQGIFLQIDNLLQKTMNRSSHMKQLQKFFGNQSSISKVESSTISKNQVLKQKNTNQKINKDRPKNSLTLRQNNFLSQEKNIKLKISNKSKNKNKSTLVNNILSNMRETIDQKVHNQSSLSYKIVKKKSSLMQSPYFKQND